MQKSIDTNIKVSSHWYVAADMQGLRADQYLMRYVGRITRQRAQRIIKGGDFLLDEAGCKVSSRVKYGQKATLKRFAPDQAQDIFDFDVGVIYEDENLLVLNKPPGLSIHPSANCLYKTLTHWLRTFFAGQKINPCHRIDKETSGIVICAKNRDAERLIKSAFMKGQVKKTYLAISDGIFASGKLINIPLGLAKNKRLVRIRMIEDEEGMPASTRVRSLLVDRKNNRSLIVCRPYTGRQHQIRVHLSLIGHPIVGDKLYNHGDELFDRMSRGVDISKELSHPRHALHAARVRLPFMKQRLVFKCPLPADLQSLIAIP